MFAAFIKIGQTQPGDTLFKFFLVFTTAVLLAPPHPDGPPALQATKNLTRFLG